MKDYIRKIINVFTASPHSEGMKQAVYRWLLDSNHASEKDAALRALWDETQAKADAGTRQSLDAVYNKVGAIVVPHPLYRRIPLWRYAAAAVVLVAVSVFATLVFTGKEYGEMVMVENFTRSGNMNRLMLPDGSEVQTNAGTILLYPERFEAETRTVYLVGEANFKVKKNPKQPFVVRSADMAVTALGTEFNVTAYPENDELLATLLEGKIKVDCGKNGESFTLSPGQQVAYLCSTGKGSLREANLEDVTAWQQGQVVFRGSTMKEIILTLERRFAVTFQYNASLLTTDKYNVRFRKDADIAEVMEVMKEVTGKFTYRIEGDTCYLKSVR